jgi:3-deoxy-manno-octulosonate cytidylyltransferase (CMP-KDO synthetase)
MVVHTFKRALLSKLLDRVIVCTDHKSILDVVKRHGGEAMLTSAKHKNGTERIHEVSKKFGKNDLIIDIQGDQPLVDPKSIDETIKFHKKNQHFDIVLPSMSISSEIENKSLVKTIFAENGRVVYFSRQKTPYNYYNKKIKYYKNLSVVSFKSSALNRYCKFKISKNEKIENIELMRAIDNGMNVGTFEIKGSDFAVDVQNDLFRAIDVMPKDKIRKQYK